MSLETLHEDDCYRAIRARDARFDGLFFTAVRTTGIYCRPVCPARTPKRRSCVFYPAAAAAERAGFRPCLRCRPELAPGRPRSAERLADAILRRLQSGALNQGGVDQLAEQIGLSSRQMRRVLFDAFGVTPIEVAQTQRLLFAKQLLHETGLPMIAVAHAAGFASLRRFNAAFKERYRMAPSQVRGMPPRSDDGLALRIAYREPLAWDAALAYLRGRAVPGVEAVQEGRYSRVVTLTCAGSIVSGWIEVSRSARGRYLQVRVAERLTPGLREISQRVRLLFDLDADPVQIDGDLSRDPGLRPCVKQTPGLRVIGAWDPFELALRAVLGQQVSVAGASTLSGRLAERFGEAITTPDVQLRRTSPSAERLAACSLEDVGSLGIPRARAATIVRLAQSVTRGLLQFPHGTTLEAMVARLIAIPGIGSWTAQYVAMRAFGQPDAFPGADLGLLRAYGALEGRPGDAPRLTEKALLQRAARWTPWRAYAAAHLWRYGFMHPK